MKSFVRVFAAATLFALFSTITIQANDKHDKRASLPAAVVSAKTVHVDNQTTSAELLNTAYTELSKWGRLQIVDTPQKSGYRAAPFERQLREVRSWRRKPSSFQAKN